MFQSGAPTINIGRNLNIKHGRVKTKESDHGAEITVIADLILEGGRREAAERKMMMTLSGEVQVREGGEAVTYLNEFRFLLNSLVQLI